MYRLVVMFDKTAYCAEHMTGLARKLDKLWASCWRVRKRMSKIQLSDHFSTGRLMRFTSPTILVMIVMSTYMIADGLFAAKFIGSSAFAAQNLIFRWRSYKEV